MSSSGIWTPAARLVRAVPDTLWGLHALHIMAYAQAWKVPSKTTLTKHRVHRDDGSGVLVTVIRPKGAKGRLPILLLLHGGGYAIGTPGQEYPLVSRLLATRPCVVVMPAYRRSIQAPYPAGLHDCYHTLLWAQANAPRLGGDSDRMIVMGPSAGGGLTAALCLMARDRQEVRIAAQFPLYAMLDDRQGAETTVDPTTLTWSQTKNRLAWHLYLKGQDPVPPYAAPARATDLSGLPPAVGFVGANDLFRNENIAYFQRLRDGGVKTRFTVIPCAYHGIETFAPKSQPGQAAWAFLNTAFAATVDDLAGR